MHLADPSSDDPGSLSAAASRRSGPPSSASRRRRSSGKVHGQKPLAVVVEDDADAATVAVSMLNILGFDTQQAADAQQALSILARTSPDLVLLDICLPDLSGADVLRVLRRLSEHAETPVLVCSAVYPENNPITQRMKEQGVLAFLPKPFSFSALRDAVSEILRGRWEPEPEPEVEAPPAHPPAGEQSLARIQGVQITRVQAVAKHRGQRLQAIVEEGSETSATVQLSGPVRVGDEVQLRIYTDGDAQKRARVRLLTRVEAVVSRRERRYRLTVDLAAPQSEWKQLCRLLGRLLGATETGDWDLAE